METSARQTTAAKHNTANTANTHSLTLTEAQKRDDKLHSSTFELFEGR